MASTRRRWCVDKYPAMKKSAKFLNAKQVAELLGLTYIQARKMFRHDQIPTIMVGKHKVTTVALLGQWMGEDAGDDNAQPAPERDGTRTFPSPFST
jgi:hypothetical protein